MKKRIRHKYPKGPWTDRIVLLLQAMGKRPELAAPHFGLKSGAHIERVMHGGRPKVSFLIRLKELEGAYAREIEAVKEGLIVPFPKGYAYHFNFLDPAARPEDIAAVGQVGVSASDGESAPPARRVVYWVDPRKSRRKANQGVEPGRPAAEPGGPASAVSGNHPVQEGVA